MGGEMSLYLVQSGTLRLTVQADDAHKAALWAVHQSFRQVLPDHRECIGAPDERTPTALGRRIRVLRQDAEEAASLETYDIVLEWNQLMIALAGLEPRPPTWMKSRRGIAGEAAGSRLTTNG